MIGNLLRELQSDGIVVCVGRVWKIHDLDFEDLRLKMKRITTKKDEKND